MKGAKSVSEAYKPPAEVIRGSLAYLSLCRQAEVKSWKAGESLNDSQYITDAQFARHSISRESVSVETPHTANSLSMSFHLSMEINRYL